MLNVTALTYAKEQCPEKIKGPGPSRRSNLLGPYKPEGFSQCTVLHPHDKSHEVYPDAMFHDILLSDMKS